MLLLNVLSYLIFETATEYVIKKYNLYFEACSY